MVADENTVHRSMLQAYVCINRRQLVFDRLVIEISGKQSDEVEVIAILVGHGY